MNSKILFSLFLFALLTACGKKEQTETDNLFKFKEYISYNTSGIQSVAAPIRIELAKPVTQYELTQELPAEYVQISPKTAGILTIENGRTLVFQPSEPLQADTEYSVTVKLSKFYTNLEKEFASYTFSFKTIAKNFKVDLGNLQSYSKAWQYVTGTLETSDVISLAQAQKLIAAQQDKKALPITWPKTAEDGRFFNFTIDSISRKIDDDQILVQWDGKSIGADNQGENTLGIPGQNNFTVIDVRTTIGPESSLAINFSDPILEKQNFAGLVTLEKSENLRFEANGNVLYVYPANPITGNTRVTVFNGIKNTEGFKLKTEFSELVSFEQLKPAVRFLTSGTILPSAQSTPIYFEAVNLSAVDVRVIKIFQNNILQFLQEEDLSSLYDLKRVGRRIAKKTIVLEDASNSMGTWKAHGIDLSELFQADPGALYSIELSFKPEYSLYRCDGVSEEIKKENLTYTDNLPTAEDLREEAYWDNELYSWRNTEYNWNERDNPCHPAYYDDERFPQTNVLGSDLGLIVKESDNQSYHFVANNLLTTAPEMGTTIKLYNYQQQLIATVTTDEQGFAVYDSDRDAAFAVAQKGNNYAYAKLDDGNALSLSKFDISGKRLQRGLKGYLYTERGVHRPGDSIHLTFVLNDNANPLPDNHPIKLEVKDARGTLIQREVTTKGAATANAANGFYYFPITTTATAPTGNWNATISVGGAKFSKTLKVATVKPNRLKLKLDFDDEILSGTKPITGTVSAMWLHGSPGRNLDVEMEATITASTSGFAAFPTYEFTDPVREFEKVEFPILKKTLSEAGSTSFSKQLELNTQAPGMLEATFLTKVFEGGGDFSMDVFTKKLAPFSYFVGLHAPEPREYGSYFTDENTVFDVVTVNDQGQVTPNRKLEVKIFKIEWRWWWNRGSDNLSRYENASVHRPVREFEITSGGNGKTSFTVNIPDRDGGRYLIRVIDKASGHAVGKTAYFYRNWDSSPQDGDAESAKMLVFSADKDKYQVGDEAVITFPSSSGSRALISIENGTEVLDKKWVETGSKETRVTLALTPEMAPNVYVNISLLQPHAWTTNDRPIRLYGVIPLAVEDPTTLLQPQLQMPDVLKPETDFNVTVSEAHGRAMTYTLAVVDEGLLDLTRFATPDIHNAFYSREALGVKTFDIYDDVIGAYSGSVGNIYAIGGGDVGAGAKNRKADRFKPVVTYLGPFQLEAGKTRSHKIHMPNYIGSVRTMVIAGDNTSGAYGSTEKATPVRKPLMVLASLPRKLSPGETVTLPVTVFAMEDKVKNAKISVKTTSALIPLDASSQTIAFASPGEQIVNFKFQVNPADIFQKITVTATGAGETATYEVEIDVENPNPVTVNSKQYTLEANANLELPYAPFGVEGSNAATIELSTLPPMDLSGRLEYLTGYPYGCIEQTVSSVFPQLYLKEVMDVTFDSKKAMDVHIKEAISRISRFQNADGGLSYWPGESRNDAWATNYAGHFMLEAKQQGYALPLSFLSNWLRYQQAQARQWRNTTTSYNASLTQAYRLYTLALAGQPELAAMNRLRESNTMSNDAKWRLAGAYALSGKPEIAKAIAQTANISFIPQDYNYHTYGSPFRNKAMALETAVLLGMDEQQEMAVSLAKTLSSHQWLSTQETAFALLGMAKMVAKNGGKSMQIAISQDGKTTNYTSERAVIQRDLELGDLAKTLSLTNKNANRVFVNFVQKGKLPVGQEIAENRNLVVKTGFYGADKKPLGVSSLQQGTSITVKIAVTNTSTDAIDNIALSQIFPSGWEVVNTSFTQLAGGASGQARYTDIRDDRVYFYFDLKARETRTFTVELNASYLGNYYLPGTQAEAMYDNTYFARNEGKWILVNE